MSISNTIITVIKTTRPVRFCSTKYEYVVTGTVSFRPGNFAPMFVGLEKVDKTEYEGISLSRELEGTVQPS